MEWRNRSSLGWLYVTSNPSSAVCLNFLIFHVWLELFVQVFICLVPLFLFTEGSVFDEEFLLSFSRLCRLDYLEGRGFTFCWHITFCLFVCLFLCVACPEQRSNWIAYHDPSHLSLFHVRCTHDVLQVVYRTPDQVQFLDRQHLLLKLGSVDGGVSVFLLSQSPFQNTIPLSFSS